MSITVIIPVYNRTTYLREAIASVLNQTMPVLEILIIDDGSELSHFTELSEIAKISSLITLYHLPTHRGVSHARNYGIDYARGDYILFLDDDDLLSPQLFELGLQELDRDQSLAGIIFSYENILPGDQKANFPTSLFDYRNEAAQLHTDSFSVLLKSCPPIHSFLLRRAVIEHQRFPEDLSIGEDWFFWLKLAHQGCRFRFNDQALVYYRRHAASISSCERNFFLTLIKFFHKLQQSGMIRARHDRFFIEMKIFMSLLKLRDPQALKYLLSSCRYPEQLARYLYWYLAHNRVNNAG